MIIGTLTGQQLDVVRAWIPDLRRENPHTLQALPVKLLESATRFRTSLS
jgi:hypothetical protein